MKGEGDLQEVAWCFIHSPHLCFSAAVFPHSEFSLSPSLAVTGVTAAVATCFYCFSFLTERSGISCRSLQDRVQGRSQRHSDGWEAIPSPLPFISLGRGQVLPAQDTGPLRLFFDLTEVLLCLAGWAGIDLFLKLDTDYSVRHSTMVVTLGQQRPPPTISWCQCALAPCFMAFLHIVEGCVCVYKLKRGKRSLSGNHDGLRYHLTLLYLE